MASVGAAHGVRMGFWEGQSPTMGGFFLSARQNEASGGKGRIRCSARHRWSHGPIRWAAVPTARSRRGMGTSRPMRMPQSASCVWLAAHLLRARAVQRTCCITEGGGGCMILPCRTTHDSDGLARPPSVREWLHCRGLVWPLSAVRIVPVFV